MLTSLERAHGLPFLPDPLDELVHRSRAEPARVVDHARLRVQLDPHEAVPRAQLIRILAAMGHRDEARTHVESGTRFAEESGSTSGLAAIMWAMRRFAPTRTTLAGAAAGLLAGGVSATVYGLHCDESTAPFVALWYSLGISLTALTGAVIGSRVLRW